jgi:hypothetical protein
VPEFAPGVVPRVRRMLTHVTTHRTRHGPVNVADGAQLATILSHRGNCRDDSWEHDAPSLRYECTRSTKYAWEDDLTSGRGDVNRLYTRMNSKSIVGELYYLDRLALYEVEKPYFCHFPIENVEGATITNVQLSPYHVEIQDLRENDGDLCLETAGFEWLHMDDEFDADAVRSSVDARRASSMNFEDIIKERLGASHALTFETIVILRRNRGMCS